MKNHPFFFLLFTPFTAHSQHHSAKNHTGMPEKADSRQQIIKIFSGTGHEQPNNVLWHSNNPITTSSECAESGQNAIFLCLLVKDGSLPKSHTVTSM